MTEARIITEPLGGSPLSQAAAAGRAPARWYVPRPVSADAWRARATELRESTPANWLDALMPALAPAGRASERLLASSAGKGVVVTTGQQPGLFGGPIYTWSKALSALALADEIQTATGIPVAPVFWAATDDSDFAESSWTIVTTPGGIDELRMDGDSTGESMSHVPLGDITALFARLERSAGSAAYREPLELARRSYRLGQTVGGAYLELLRGILEPLGISVLDASHPAVRRAGAALIRQALRTADSVAAAVSARDRELMAEGHSPQVAGIANLSLVFATTNGVRERVPVADSASVANTLPVEALSPNVLLRPVVERSILPTIAYVAGPAELAYFAQSSAVAEVLDVQAPLGVPRWSCTILEPHVAEIMSRLALSQDDLRDPHAAEGRLASSALPADVSSAFARMRNAIDEGILALQGHGGDLVPDAVIDGGARSVAHRLARMERRFIAASKRRMGAVLQDVGTARGSLYPGGKRQERALNFIPLLARTGRPLLDAMLDAARAHAAALVRGTSSDAATASAAGAPANSA